MKFLRLMSAGILLITATAGFSQSTDDSKIKLYTFVGNPGAMAIDSPVDISMIIDGKLVISQNHGRSPEHMDGSYVEVDNSLDSKEITEAKFNWAVHGKHYFCNAFNLPLYVQKGDINTATQIFFDCKAT